MISRPGDRAQARGMARVSRCLLESRPMGIGRRKLALLALGAALGLSSLARATRAGDTAEKQETGKGPQGPLLEWIPDAYPTLPRLIGYEYNQKNHHDVPAFEDTGFRPLED